MDDDFEYAKAALVRLDDEQGKVQARQRAAMTELSACHERQRAMWIERDAWQKRLNETTNRPQGEE